MRLQGNIEMVRAILAQCWRLGVRDIVLCPGARNAPFVVQLAAPNPFRVWPFFEERSAAFFALGKIQATRRPVAVITTSGTAAAELLPATIEADYQRLPLILITADRPRSYRGSGSPQSIHQPGLYSHYVSHSEDWQSGDTLANQTLADRPVHWNVCFDEPLLGEEVLPLTWSGAEAQGTPPTVPSVPVLSVPVPFIRCAPAFAPRLERPLVLVGGLLAHERESVARCLSTWRRPLYLEAHSGLRGHPALEEFALWGGEKSMARGTYDGVIRIGSVPTARTWRDLEKSQLPVVHYSHLPFSGMARERTVHPLSALPTGEIFAPWAATERALDRGLAATCTQLLARFPGSEPAWMAWLSEALPARARIFLGNSLPIREWDFAAKRCVTSEVFANRGANGIDGLISTFLGLAGDETSNWCVVGDLSALYDLSGLWAARHGKINNLNLVIINNDGGRIFQRMFRQPLFENQHGLNFKAWAEMWQWDYARWIAPAPLLTSMPASVRPRVIEIVPDLAQSDAFWTAWEAL